MAAFFAASLLYLACLPVGAAALKACGRPVRHGYGAAIGFAVLIVVTSVAIRLPGDDTTSALVTGVVVAASAAYAGRDLLRAPRLETVVATVALALAVCLPFAVAGQVGIQGVAINFDMSVHVAWAETLRSTGIGEPLPLPTSSGYPLGPHAVAATIAQALGIGTDDAFIGLLMAVPLLAYLAATSLLQPLPRRPRALAAALVALPYLVAAYYGQGAFKEPIEALFLIAFLAVFREMTLARRLDGGGLALLALIGAGSFYNYSYLGLSWFAATLAVWAALELAFGGGWLRPSSALEAVRGLRRLPRRTIAIGAGFTVVLLAALAPELVRALDFFRVVSFSPAGAGGIPTANVGNLSQSLSPFEALGLWPNDDFRTYFEAPRDAYKAGLAGAVALVGLGVGGAGWLRRRDFVLPAALVGAAAIYLYLDLGDESPYVQAKALVVLAPVAMAIALGGVLVARESAAGELRAAAGLLAVTIATLAVVSSALALRGSYVGPHEHGDELASMRATVAESDVLLLPADFFGNYRLRGSRVSGVVIAQPVRLDPRPAKAYKPGRGLDFDWVDAATLDRFDYVVAARSRYASEPPANFRRVRTTDSYELWRRSGRTPRRRILAAEGLDPGAVLDCSTPGGRRLRDREGWARVTPRPALAVGPPGRRVPRGTRQSLERGGSIGRRLVLGPGRYELSLVYTAPRRPRVEARGLRADPVPQLDPPGTFWRVGELDWPGGRLDVRIEAARMHLGGRQVTDVGELAAVRLDAPRRLVPLRRACGRYVDWYTLGRHRPPVPRRGI